MKTAKTREMLIKVATMYYIGNHTQEEIANILKCSRTKVSRLLDYARKMKIIEFKINHSSSLNDEWAVKIKKYFGIKDVIVVSSEFNSDITKKVIGKVASGYLNDLLVNDINIGLAWGTTINAFVKNFTPSKQINNSWVVQLNGGANIESDSLYMDGTEIVKSLARKINSQSSVLQAPYIVKNRLLKKLLMEEDIVKRHFERFKSLDIAIVGLASIIPEDNIAFKAKYISIEESKALIESSLVGELCGNRFNIDGEEKECLLSDRVFAINLETLKNIPLVIAMGEGDRKAIPTLAALKGGYIDVLIIDELLALSIISMENIK